MPNIKSAEKRVKVIKVKTMQNQMVKTALKTTLKKFDQAINGGDKEVIKVAFTTAIKKIDMACTKGILHKNTASNKKSQLTIKYNATIIA